MPIVSAIQQAEVDRASTMSHASSKLRLAIRLNTHCASANAIQPTETATNRPRNTLRDDSRVVVPADGRMTRKEEAADTKWTEAVRILVAAGLWRIRSGTGRSYAG